MHPDLWPEATPPPTQSAPGAASKPSTAKPTTSRAERAPARDTGNRRSGTGQGDRYRSVKLVLGEEPSEWIGRLRDPQRKADPDNPDDRDGKVVYAAIAERINQLIQKHGAGFRVSHEFARRWDPTNPDSPSYQAPAAKKPSRSSTSSKRVPAAKFQPPDASASQ